MRSLLRKLEYERLEKVHIDGAILDIGGSKKSGYHELIKGQHAICTANIDQSYEADIIFDAEKTWPYENQTFQAVLMINVLEHLYEFATALREANRVLDKKGKCIIVVPFMFPVHGSPSDFHRFTRHALERHLQNAGFTTIEVEELGTGAASVVYHAIIGFMKWPWLSRFTARVLTSFDKVISIMAPGNLMGPSQYPLGYFVTAYK